MTQAKVRSAEWVSDIKVLSFDLDDTLWDCAPAIEKAEAKLSQWFRDNTPKVVEQHSPESIARRRAMAVQQHPEIACDMTLLRRKMIEFALVESGYSADLTDAAFDAFYRARSDVVLYANTHQVLEKLSQRFQLAVITNGNADLSLIGLADYFQHIQRASIDRAPKPEPQMFDMCLEAFGIDPSELAHVGDNINTDVGGAQRVGARTVWYNQSGMQWPAPSNQKQSSEKQPHKALQEADVEVDSLLALLEFFIPE